MPLRLAWATCAFKASLNCIRRTCLNKEKKTLNRICFTLPKSSTDKEPQIFSQQSILNHYPQTKAKKTEREVDHKEQNPGQMSRSSTNQYLQPGSLGFLFPHLQGEGNSCSTIACMLLGLVEICKKCLTKTKVLLSSDGALFTWSPVATSSTVCHSHVCFSEITPTFTSRAMATACLYVGKR